MKKIFSLKWLTVLALACFITFTSCQKNIRDTTTVADTEDATLSQNVSEDDAVAETQFDDVFNITMSVQASDVGDDIGVGGGFGIYGRTNENGRVDSTSRCFTVSVVPSIPHVFPKTVTLDFGTGCLGRDGKLRKGKIVTIYTGPMLIPGSQASTTFVDYFVDSFKIAGTHIVTNTSTSNLQGWNVKVINGKITNTNTSRWRMWNSEKNILQTEGNGTPGYPLDDVFKITGNANGSNSGGNVWTSAIIEPLIKKFSCNWLVKGKVQITRNGNVAILDYGNGNCDNQATVTVNGVTHIITLR